jgi:flagellar biogenesis protein FliO
MVVGVSTILTAVAALAAVLALIWLAGRLARFGGMAQRAAKGGPLAVRDVLVLGPRHRLYLISCDQRRILLLIGGAQDTVVGWVDREEPGT